MAKFLNLALVLAFVASAGLVVAQDSGDLSAPRTDNLLNSPVQTLPGPFGGGGVVNSGANPGAAPLGTDAAVTITAVSE